MVNVWLLKLEKGKLKLIPYPKKIVKKKLKGGTKKVK